MENDFFVAVQRLVEETLSAGNKTLAQKMVTTSNCFANFVGGQQLALDKFTRELLGDFEQWLVEERHVSTSTAAFYQRSLSIIYHRLVAKGWTEDRSPFDGVQLQFRNRKSVKLLALDTIRRVRDIDLSDQPESMVLARDLFMLCFYLEGMPFSQMAMLRKDMLRSGWLMADMINENLKPMLWQTCMQDIIDRHPSRTPFLLPIITDGTRKVPSQIRYQEAKAKQHLDKLSKMVGSPVQLSFVVARQSWNEIRNNMTPLQLLCHRFTPATPAQNTGCCCC